jgi:hypothetical protein
LRAAKWKIQNGASIFQWLAKIFSIHCPGKPAVILPAMNLNRFGAQICGLSVTDRDAQIMTTKPHHRLKGTVYGTHDCSGRFGGSRNSYCFGHLVDCALDRRQKRHRGTFPSHRRAGMGFVSLETGTRTGAA